MEVQARATKAYLEALKSGGTKSNDTGTGGSAAAADEALTVAYHKHAQATVARWWALSGELLFTFSDGCAALLLLLKCPYAMSSPRSACKNAR